MNECIFCKIANKEIKSDIVYESENIIAFHDLNPAAPTHILFIPKNHYRNLSDIPDEKISLISELFNALKDIAKKENVVESGYRVVINTNKNAGQEIFHVHIHLIGGKPLGKMA